VFPMRYDRLYRIKVKLFRNRTWRPIDVSCEVRVSSIHKNGYPVIADAGP
jgi:hypothetical protein